jgi:WD40 repeat protein
LNSHLLNPTPLGNNPSISNEILYFSINQDSNYIAVSTFSGFKIFSVSPFQLLYESCCGPISIVEMLHNSNVIILVGLTEYRDFSPNKLVLWLTDRNCAVKNSTNFQSKIIALKINKCRMVVAERNYIHIFSTGEIQKMHTYEVNNICLGKLVLSNNVDKNVWLCFSTSLDQGEVKIYDTLYPSTKKIQIKAHKSPILKLALSNKGDRLATCSCKGTIIRIFSLPEGEKICTFKRGINPAFIFSMNFSKEGDKLLISSDKGIINLFDIEEELENLKENKEAKGFKKVIYRSFITIVSKIIPSDYEDSFASQGSEISYSGDDIKISNVVGFCGDKIKEAFSFSSDGTFNRYSIDYVNKKMIKEESHNIKDMKEVDNKAPSIYDSFSYGNSNDNNNNINYDGLFD